MGLLYTQILEYAPCLVQGQTLKPMPGCYPKVMNIEYLLDPSYTACLQDEDILVQDLATSNWRHLGLCDSCSLGCSSTYQLDNVR